MLLAKLKHLSQSSSFRFALLTMGVIWLSICTVLALLYWQLRQSIWHDLDTRLSEQSLYVQRLAENSPQLSTRQLADIVNASGEFTLRSASLDQQQAAANEAFRQHMASMPQGMQRRMANMPESMRQRMARMHHQRWMATPPEDLPLQTEQAEGQQSLIARTIGLPNGETVRLTRNIDYLHDLDRSMFRSLLLGISLTLLLALIGSVLLTRRSLQGLNRINEACSTIMAGDLTHRIPIEPQANARKPDDHAQMAININAMLDRIQALMQQVRQVSDNIAHDLKSPLARLRTRLELQQQRAPSDELQAAIDDADRLLAMFKRLLGLARLEAGQLQNITEINMPTLLNDVCELYEPVLEEQQISMECHFVDGTIKGDADLLFQALSNLLDNASKFTPAKGRIRVTGCQETDHYLITIHDSGPGIPPAEHDRVFERFHRLDSARTTPGFGLGLSLVQAIVKLHGGVTTLDNADGLKAQIRLPVTLQ